MSDEARNDDPGLEAGASRLGLRLVAGGFLALFLAGGLLWWRDGERLFTEGLIAAIARCF